jgi:hypothetical protein
MLIPDPRVCEHYGINPRTLPRWDADPDLKFPPPTYINGRKYRDAEALAAWDRWRAAGGGERRPLRGVAKRAVAATLDRLKQEIAAAPSRADAVAVLCAAALPALSDEERAQAQEEITDILNELPEEQIAAAV